MKRSLALRSEHLSELTPADLTQVVGGSHQCNTNPPNRCLSLQVCEATHEAACHVPTFQPVCDR